MSDEIAIARSRERFAREIAEHQIDVIRDDGLYRHLRFKRPGTSSYYFDLVTWPGYLVVAGDCGDFMFSRTRDMFEFFAPSGARGGFEDARWGINPHYWSEKLRAPKRDAARRYSEDAYKARVSEWRDDVVKDHWDDPTDPDLVVDERAMIERARGKFRSDVQEQLLDHEAYSAEEAMRLLHDFDGEPGIYDAWEWDLSEYDWQFLWCCWAIVWGIGQYNAAKAAEPGGRMTSDRQALLRRSDAARLRADGWEYHQIARELGVGKSTVYRWLNPEATAATERRRRTYKAGWDRDNYERISKDECACGEQKHKNNERCQGCADATAAVRGTLTEGM